MRWAVLAVMLAVGSSAGAEELKPGDTTRTLTVDGRTREYVLHVPHGYDASKPTPVVLVLHGAMGNGRVAMRMSGMTHKADEAGFLAVFPSGTGNRPFLVWNAGGVTRFWSKARADDVKFISQVLDDVQAVANVDAKRVYATGISNGGMMCYRLADKLSDRIAAIAPVAGTMTEATASPRRPVPVLHFHGTKDKLVPLEGRDERERAFRLQPVAHAIEVWRTNNECPKEPEVTDLPNLKDDGTTVKQFTYGPGKNGSEVVYVEVLGGGHTWPGRQLALGALGLSTFDISANDMIWEFFEKHPMP